MSTPTDILASIEANVQKAKGLKFTGWFQREYFIEGTSARRIASWLQRPAIPQPEAAQ